MKERKLAKRFKQLSKELGDYPLRDFDIFNM